MDPLAHNVAARVANSPDHILGMIVKGVLAERNVASLIDAWTEAAVDDWEEVNEEPSEVSDERWRVKELGYVLSKTDVEKLFNKTYVDAYRHMNRHMSRADALATLMWPHRFPLKEMPRAIIEGVATALGVQEGREGKALMDYAQRHMGR